MIWFYILFGLIVYSLIGAGIAGVAIKVCEWDPNRTSHWENVMFTAIFWPIALFVIFVPRLAWAIAAKLEEK